MSYAVAIPITQHLHGRLKSTLLSLAKETSKANFVFACALCNIERDDAETLHEEMTKYN